jgi:hypothetical protein
MSSDPTEVARQIGLKGPQALKQLKRMMRRLLSRHHLAVELFLGEGGKLTEPAREWMQQLAADNYVNKGAWHADPREHAYREGRRALALEIIGSAHLDVERLASLKKMEKEIESD